MKEIGSGEVEGGREGKGGGSKEWSCGVKFY